MRFFILVSSAVLSLFVSFSVSAADEPLSFSEIREQQIEVRADVDANRSPYDDMSQRDRERLVQRQDDFLHLIEGKASLLDLDERGRTEAINSLEWIRAEISGAEEDRLICKRVTRVGTHMKERVCRTVAERRKDLENSRKLWGTGNPCSNPNGCTTANAMSGDR
ncbi:MULTISPECIES: hypothetical protein [unclassified Lysobacter]